MVKWIIKKRVALLVILTITLTRGNAQPAMDTTSLIYAFAKGSVHGHLRNIVMVTNNAPGLTDYYADAIGAHILYQTAGFHGFRFAAGTHFTYRTFSSDLAKADPVTGALNRYEGTLFDVSALSKRSSPALLSVLNVSYQFKESRIILGRQLLNTPFVNMQDNRMQPTAVEGIYADIHINKWRWEAAWLSGIAPRGTMKWYSVAASMGKYPQGINSNGTPGNYSGNVRSNGIGVLGVHWQPISTLHLQLWEQYNDNLFNTVLLQGDYKIPAGKNMWISGFQYINQYVIGDGGHSDPYKAYFGAGNKVNIIGARVGWENKHARFLLNYTRIMAGGRFTMPREWGTEPFFTFLSRERNEGAGDVHAISASARYEFPKQHLTVEAGYGRYHLPDVKQYSLNKYGVPSYDHTKFAIDYAGTGMLANLKLSALCVYKQRKGAYYDNLRYVINKVNVCTYAIVINYLF